MQTEISLCVSVSQGPSKAYCWDDTISSALIAYFWGMNKRVAYVYAADTPVDADNSRPRSSVDPEVDCKQLQ